MVWEALATCLPSKTWDRVTELLGSIKEVEPWGGEREREREREISERKIYRIFFFGFLWKEFRMANGIPID